MVKRLTGDTLRAHWQSLASTSTWLRITPLDPDGPTAIFGHPRSYDARSEILWCQVGATSDLGKYYDGLLALVNYAAEAAEHRCHVQLCVGRSSGAGQTVGLFLPGSVAVGDLRSWPRVPLSPGEMVLHGQTRGFAAEVRDISLGGMGLKVTEGQAPGERTRFGRLEIELTGQRYLELPDSTFQVVRQAGTLDVGVQFVRLEDAGRRFLSRYVAALLEEDLAAGAGEGLPARARAASRVPARDAPRILVIDDRPQAVRTLERLIREERPDCAVIGETSPFRALRGIHDLAPHLILLDLYMRPVGGLQLLRLLSGDATLRLIPVVVVSVSPRQSDVVKARQLGAQFYLLKPVRRGLLRATLNHYLPVGGGPAGATSGLAPESKS